MGVSRPFCQVPSSLLLQRVPALLIPLDPTKAGKHQEMLQLFVGHGFLSDCKVSEW